MEGTTKTISSIYDHDVKLFLSFLDLRELSCIRMGATIPQIPQTNYRNGKTLMDLSAMKILY